MLHPTQSAMAPCSLCSMHQARWRCSRLRPLRWLHFCERRRHRSDLAFKCYATLTTQARSTVGHTSALLKYALACWWVFMRSLPQIYRSNPLFCCQVTKFAQVHISRVSTSTVPDIFITFTIIINFLWGI